MTAAIYKIYNEYHAKDLICVLTPTPEALKIFTIKEIAEKDIPEGTPFWVVDRSEIPEKSEEREIKIEWGEASGVGKKEIIKQ